MKKYLKYMLINLIKNTLFMLLFVNICCANENKKGQEIYNKNCILCHGINGNGRVAKLYKIRPSNFKASKISKKYAINIITNGGQKMSRSNIMPTWKNELSKEEIELVANFIISIRKNKINNPIK